MAALTVTVSGDERSRHLTFRGRLDESAVLVAQAAGWAARQVVLDTSEVAFINSIGIREWMHLLATLDQGGAEIVHERCSEPMVEQMCFIPAVRGGGQVKSCFAPFGCSGCGHEASVLLDIAAERPRLLESVVPRPPCPRCQAPMDFADLPARWFAFLRA